MTYYPARISFIKKYLTSLETSEVPPIILAEKAIIAAPDHIKAPRMLQKKRHVKGLIDFYIGNVLLRGND